MKLTKHLVWMAICAAGCLAFAAGGQTTDSNPGHSPDVFLDNHRPLIEKKGKAPTTRTATGQVVDDSGQPLEGALVTLTDTKTKEKTTFFTKKDGRYRFEDLSFSIDYQLQARWKTLLSDERKLSQYDHAAKIVRILEVTTPEGVPAAPKAQARKEEAKAKP
ncbi:MAG TPA: carboxypeptidase-like regulatory domain-containing protein [Bryobacteraceae bacterium]|jgi:hypothetical protein